MEYTKLKAIYVVYEDINQGIVKGHTYVQWMTEWTRINEEFFILKPILYQGAIFLM